jgi:hypothetical protein
MQKKTKYVYIHDIPELASDALKLAFVKSEQGVVHGDISLTKCLRNHHNHLENFRLSFNISTSR